MSVTIRLLNSEGTVAHHIGDRLQKLKNSTSKVEFRSSLFVNLPVACLKVSTQTTVVHAHNLLWFWMMKLRNTIRFSFSQTLHGQRNQLKLVEISPWDKLLFVIINVASFHHQMFVASFHAKIGFVQSQCKAVIVSLQYIVFVSIFAAIADPNGIPRFAVTVQTIGVGFAAMHPSIILKEYGKGLEQAHGSDFIPLNNLYNTYSAILRTRHTFQTPKAFFCFLLPKVVLAPVET